MKLEFESNVSALPFTANSFPVADESEISSEKISQMLVAGIKAAQNGNRNQARQLLIEVTEAEPRNETAWLWMASISEYPEELIIFLNNVLSINPNNPRALEWMSSTKSLLAKTFVRRGAEALEDANRDFAKQCFLQALTHDSRSEAAWQSLAEVADSAEEKVSHLQKVLGINPENETAQAALQTLKREEAEKILRTANQAAISGDREEARELLEQVLQQLPELEDAWMLKSYLADSFSEKVTAFEKVLSLNPENDLATAGLASLRAMMAKTEAQKAEQAAIIAEFDKNMSEQESAAEDSSADDSAEQSESEAQPETVAVADEDETVLKADDAEEEENNPTQELEYPPDFVSSEFYGRQFQEADANAAPNETVEQSDLSADEQSNFFVEATPNSPVEEYSSDVEEYSSEKENLAEESSVENEILMEENLMEENFAGEAENFTAETSPEESPTEEHRAEETPAGIIIEMIACPFCRAENEATAFVCGSCRTILTLSDLEMLFAHTEVDQEVLLQAVERMEAENGVRDFNADELKNLAIGQINLKNLRQGAAYLQKAAQLNPNDVILASQVNSLKIRLAEIEQQQSAHSSAVKNKKILVVDDSATIRKLIASKLEKTGHEVVCAVDGVDALEKVKEFVPDLILLDIMMPQLDGYQVCKMIRASEMTKNVPVVMISGKDGFFDKVRGRMAGTTGYITKPFGPEMLMKTVESYLFQQDPMTAETEEA